MNIFAHIGMKNATHNQLNNTISARNAAAAAAAAAAATTVTPNIIHKAGPNAQSTTNNCNKMIKQQQQPHSNRAPVTNEQPQNIVRPQIVTTKQFTSSITPCVPHAKALYDFISKEPT